MKAKERKMREIGSQIPRALARVHCDNKPRQIGLNPDYNRTFFISTREWQYSQLKRLIWYSKRGPFHVLFSLLRHVVPINDGNCRLTPVVKRRCVRDELPQAIDIGVLNATKQFFHNMIYIYSESVNLIDNCNVAFDSINLWNHPKTVPVIGMESMVTRARLCYTWDYLPPGINSLIKPDAMAKLISFPTKIITVML